MYFEFHVSTLIIAAIVCIMIGLLMGDNGGNGPDCW